MTEQYVMPIEPWQAFLFIAAGFLLMIGFLIIWNAKTKIKKPKKKRNGKDKYYTQGEVWVAKLLKKQL